MSQIRVVAWALVTIDNSVLVQCDEKESFYRLPGGTVEFGETAAAACVRELREEFGIEVDTGDLAAVYENVDFNEVVLIHHCHLVENIPIEQLPHHEVPGVHLVWKTVDQLTERPTAPPQLKELIVHRGGPPVHLVKGGPLS